MGTGIFRNGNFDFVVVANHNMSVADQNAWRRSFEKASELLYNASEGQMQFGRLFFSNESVGLNQADIILDSEDGISHATVGGYRSLGGSITLKAYVKVMPLTILHELGHYIWSLGDEYISKPFIKVVDLSVTSPDRRTIPIEVDNDPALTRNSIVGASVKLKFDDEYFTRIVVSNTDARIVVDEPYPKLPTEADIENGFSFAIYTVPAECQTNSNSNYCIMDATGDSAGVFDPSGSWVPSANPVTEYCTATNHDLDEDTAQEAFHGKDCWSTIHDTDGFQHLIVPAEGGSGPTTGFTRPDWIILEKKPRFVLALDRSGSMREGTKMGDAQRGALLWMDYSKEDGDDLAILWYNNNVSRILSMSDVGSLDTGPVTMAIQNLTPRGSTNILGALNAAKEEINPYPNRSATQAVLLLTDGLHNTPAGTSPYEVISDFQDAGIQIYTLGAGSPDEVDLDTLMNLSLATSAFCYPTGENEPDAVRDAMADINLIVRGGLITSLPIVLNEKPVNALSIFPGQAGHPSLQQIMDIMGVNDISGLLRQEFQKPAQIYTLPVSVEKGSQRASFSILFEKPNQLWLYLVDPKGRKVDQGYPGMKLVTGIAPHEFIVIDRPVPGRWLMVVVRHKAGPKLRFRALAGSKNSSLQTFGGVTSFVEPGMPIRLWASARWSDELSGLTVTASITDPRGRKFRVNLGDHKSDEPHSGQYEGLITPTQTGYYKGYIRINNTRNAILANGINRLHHSRQKSLSLKIKVPSFTRIIPINFFVGKRVPVRDRDKT